MGVCVQEPREKKRNHELHYTEWTTFQDSVDGWRAGGSVVVTVRAEDLTGGDTECMSRRHHGRTSRKDQDVQYPAKKSERDFYFFKHLVREK